MHTFFFFFFFQNPSFFFYRKFFCCLLLPINIFFSLYDTYVFLFQRHVHSWEKCRNKGKKITPYIEDFFYILYIFPLYFLLYKTLIILLLLFF